MTGSETGCPLCDPDEECPGQHTLTEEQPLLDRIAALEATNQELTAELSIARAELDRHRCQAIIETFHRNEHLSVEESARLVDLVLADSFEMKFEIGRCRACRGKGRVMEQGCMGGSMQRCTHCMGRGQTSRVVLPWETEGET